jgi:serine/threonine-protein kinase
VLLAPLLALVVGGIVTMKLLPTKGTAVTDLRIPTSTNDKARAAYIVGIQATHDANVPVMRREFQLAAELDPTMGMAWFRLADVCWAMNERQTAADAMRRALGLRATMEPRDVDLMLAQEPIMVHDKADYAESLKRFDALTDKYPQDAECHLNRAFVELSAGHPELAHVSTKKALALDPTYATAMLVDAFAFEKERRPEDAQKAFETCARMSASATTCAYNVALSSGNRGRCDAMVEETKRLLDGDSEGASAWRLRASALARQGEGVEMLRPVLQRWAAATPDAPTCSSVVEAKLAMWNGDFDGAARILRDAAETSMKDTSGTRRSEILRMQLEVALESEPRDDAVRIARGFVNERGTWLTIRTPNAALTDHTGVLLVAARDLEVLKDADWKRARDAWLEEWKRALPNAELELWTMAFAVPARTKADAEEALAKMPALDLAKVEDMEIIAPAALVHALAGETDTAAPLLERASKSCFTFDPVARHMRVLDAQGRLHEAKGDKAKACEAYKGVTARWGAAKPKSVTAASVAERARRLGCGGL